MAFDINKLALVDTTDVFLKDPAGNALYEDEEQTKPLYITVYGPGSKRNRDASHALAGRYALRNKKGKELSPQEAEEEFAEFMAACSAKTNLAFGDEPISSKEDFKKLYTTPNLAVWINPQVQEAIKEAGNFLAQ